MRRPPSGEDSRRWARAGVAQVALLSAVSLFVPALGQEGGATIELVGDATVSGLIGVDIDGDLDVDLAAIGTRRVVVFSNDGEGRFREAGGFPTDLAPMALLATELDADPWVDLVVGNFGSRSLTVGYGDGSGQFSRVESVPSGVPPRALATGDFDDNDRVDVVVAGGERVAILLGRADGGLGAPLVLDTPVEFPHLVLVGDMNEDGRDDFVIWGRAARPPYMVVHERLPGRPAAFREVALDSELLDPTRSSLAAAIADFDDDGQDEVLVFLSSFVAGQHTGLFFLIEGGGPGYTVQPWSANTLPGFTSSTLLPVRTDDSSPPGALVAGSSAGQGGLWLIPTPFSVAPEFVFEPCFVELSSPPALLSGSAAAADFDRDGKLDAAVALGAEARIEIVFSVSEHCRMDEICYEPEDVSFSVAGLSTLAAAGEFIVAPGPARDEVVVLAGGTAELLAREAGAFSVVATFSVPVAIGGLSAFDIDRDGLADLAITDFAQGTVDLYFATGSPVAPFVRESLAVGVLPAGVTAEDLDGDGITDIALSLWESDAVSVLFGRGGRRFSDAARFDVGAEPRGIAAGDIDGDGLTDLVVASARAEHLSLLLGEVNGAGEFSFRSVEGPRISPDPRDVVVSDFDRNGRADIVVLSRETERVTIFRSFEDRWRGRLLFLAAGSGPTAITLGDFTGDGLTDFAVANAGARRLDIFSGDASGAFALTEVLVLEFAQGQDAPLSLAPGDVDGDGLVDLVLGDSGAGVTTVYRSLGCGASRPFRRGDVDGNRRVNLSDAVRTLLYLFSGAGGLECPDAADTDDDGRISLTDAVALLDHLFRGGPPPASPGLRECGADQVDDELAECGESGC